MLGYGKAVMSFHKPQSLLLNHFLKAFIITDRSCALFYRDADVRCIVKYNKESRLGFFIRTGKKTDGGGDNEHFNECLLVISADF